MYLLFSFSVIALSWNAMSRNKSNTQIFPYIIFLYVSFYFYFLRTLLLNVYSFIYEFRSPTAIPHDNIFIKIYFLHYLFKFIQIYIFPFFVLRLLRQFFKSGICNLTCTSEKLLFISVIFIGVLIIFLVKLLSFAKTNMVAKEYYTTFQ